MLKFLLNFRSRFTGLFLDLVDARLYDCVRIAFAAMSLLNLAQFWPDRASFFTDAGMIDQASVRTQAMGDYFTVFEILHDLTAVSAYMLFNGGAMILLLIGVLPRMSALIVFVWYVSYITRVPLVVVGWDTVLQSLSFLVLVSPMPMRWSLRAIMSRRKAVSVQLVPCYGLTLMRMQVLVIYWQAVLARLESSFWIKGEFMSYFLLSHNARWPGLWVVDYEFLLQVSTYLVLLVEILIPVLLMIRQWRWLGFIAGFLLHAGICVISLNLGMFFLTMMTYYLSFLRQEDIEWLERCFRSRTKPRGS